MVDTTCSMSGGQVDMYPNKLVCYAPAAIHTDA